MNPLFNAMSNTNLSTIKSAFTSSKNPMLLFNQLAQTNPSLQPIVQALNSGANPKEILAQECAKRGIDVNQFINKL